MIKVLPSGSFDFGMPTASLVDVHSRGVDKAWTVKRASLFKNEITNIRPERGHSFIHLIDMGALEAYGCNRNGDGFNEKAGSFELPEPKDGVSKIIQLKGGLTEYHPTFMKYAHVYKHHQNKDPKKAIGEVKAAAYNQDMRRGELIIKVADDHPDWKNDVENLAKGKDIPFSMACKVAYDICSICGNRAPTRAEYCDHLTNHMSEITKEGHSVYAHNDAPTFFDISKVFKPADRIAYSLQKVASLTLELGGLSGAALAERMGVTAPDSLEWLDKLGSQSTSSGVIAKIAAARKLAEIEKQIEAMAKGCNNGHLKSLAKGLPKGRLPKEAMDKLAGERLESVLGALGDAKIMLSVSDFLKLVNNGKGEDLSSQVEDELPGIHSCCGGDHASDGSYDGESSFLPRHIKDMITQLAGDHSLSDSPAERRVRITIIRGGSPILRSEEKKATVNAEVKTLAREYAKYQLSFATRAKSAELLTVLSNYFTV